MKYRPKFPDRFRCIQDSRTFCQTFFPWYNDEHRHSGIGMMYPAMVHHGLAAAVRENRQATPDVAYAAHPERLERGAVDNTRNAAISCQSVFLRALL